jgi:prolyl-tRNA synthetase
LRVSQLFGDTLREAPADSDSQSHQLLLRAGYVRQLAAGIFSYLPLAWRSIRRIEQILREEMDRIGGQELNMPVVHPADLWKQTGRWQAIDDSLVRFQDRGDRDMVLAMTHEEVVAQLASTELRSYRQLPQIVYQMQTKFRDEPRARGGLIRVREFIMKDSYSLCATTDQLDRQYDAHYRAYGRIGERAALPLIAVSSDVGMMGGSAAHEFMYITPMGEDTLALCDACDYAANREVARFRKEPLASEEPRPAVRVRTPNAETIASLATFLGVAPERTLKAVFLMGTFADRRPKLVIALVRGDMDVNWTQVQNLAGATALRAAVREEIMAAGAVPGYGSAIGIDRSAALVIADDLLEHSSNLVAGANEEGYHLIDTNFGRDYTADRVGPVASVYEGAPCERCAAPLRLVRGVEVGNIFKLGTKYSAALDARFTDESGVEHPIIMGSYGIGVGRLLACVAEEHRDEHGLALPISVAPYAVTLVALARTDGTRERAESLYSALQTSGVDVLYDDRDVSPGVKFADADLRGMPLRVTVSDRSLKQESVEIKHRRGGEPFLVPYAEAVPCVRREIERLWEGLREPVDGPTMDGHRTA